MLFKGRFYFASMTSVKATSELSEKLRAKYGYSTTQVERMLSFPKMRRYQTENPLRPWLMIAEVVEVHNCAAGTRVGQRLVLHAAGDLDPSASDAGLCLWAIAPLLALDHVVYDRLTDGLDPNDMWRDSVTCAGEHPECAGQCRVKLKVHLEKGDAPLPPPRLQSHPRRKGPDPAPDDDTNPWRRLTGLRGMTEREANAALARPKLARYHSDPDLRAHFRQKRIIAQVIRCDGCAPGNTTGKQLVMDAHGILLPDESTAIPCLWALAPMLDFVHIIYDRLLQGVEPDDMLPHTVWCADSGVECGGWGRVCVKISVKAPETRQ